MRSVKSFLLMGLLVVLAGCKESQETVNTSKVTLKDINEVPELSQMDKEVKGYYTQSVSHARLQACLKEMRQKPKNKEGKVPVNLKAGRSYISPEPYISRCVGVLMIS